METGKTTKSLENNDFFTAGQSGCDGEGAIAKHSPGENVKTQTCPGFETSSAVAGVAKEKVAVLFVFNAPSWDYPGCRNHHGDDEQMCPHQDSDEH